MDLHLVTEMVLTTPYKTVLDDDEVILFMGKFNK